MRYDAKHWRDRAEEMLTLAEDMHDRNARRTMLRLVADYEQLALQYEERERKERGQQISRDGQ